MVLLLDIWRRQILNLFIYNEDPSHLDDGEAKRADAEAERGEIKRQDGVLRIRSTRHRRPIVISLPLRTLKW